MTDTKEGLLSFNMFLALVLLIPSGMLLIQFLDELGKTCAQAESTIMFAIITGCVVLLSLMNFVKALLME